MEDGRCLLDVIGDPDALDLFLDREADGQASAAATEAGLLNASTAYPGLLQKAHCTSTVTASLQEAHTQAGVQQLTQAGHTGQTQVFSSHLQPQPQLVVSQAVTSYALPQLIASHTTAQLIAANSSATQLVANQADTRLAASGQKILVTSLNGQVPVWPTTGIQPQCIGQLTAATPASSTGLVQNSFSRASPQVVQQNSTQFRPVVSVCAPSGGQPVIVQACPSSTQQWQPQATSQQSTVSAVNVTQLQQPGGGVGQQVAAVKPPSLVASQGGLQLGQVGMQLIQTSLGNKLLIPSQPLVAGLNGQQLNVTTLRGLQMASQQQQQLGQVVNAAVQSTVKSAPVTQGVATSVAPTHIILQQGQQPVIAPNQNIIFRAMPSNIVQLQQGVVQGTPRQGNPSQPILITSQLPSLQLQQQLLQQPQQQQLSLSSSVLTTQTTTAAQVNQNLKPGNILVNIGGQNVSVTLDQLQRLQQQLQQQQQQLQLQQQQQLQLQQQQQQQQQVKKIANIVNSPVQVLPGTPQQPQTIMLTMQQLQQLQQRMQQQPQQQVIVNKQQTQPVLTVPVGMTTSTLTTATAKTKLIQSNYVATNGIQAMPTESFIGSPQKQPLGGQTTSASNVGHRVLPVVTSSQGIVAASSAPIQAVTATSKAGGQAKLQHPPARIVAPNVNIQTMGLSSKPTYGTKVSAASSWPGSQVAAPTAPAVSSTVVPSGTGSTTVVNKQLAERLQGQIHVLLSMQYRTEEQQRWLEQLTQMLQKVTTQLSGQGEQAINGGQQASQTSTGGTSTTAIRQQVFTPPVIQVAPLVVASGTSAVTTTVTAALTATMTPMLGTPKLQTAVTMGGVTNTQQQQQQQQQQQASWASLPASVRERLQAQLAHMTPDQQLLFYKNQDIVLQKLQQQMLKQQQVLKQQQLAAGPVRCQITTSDKRPGTVRTSLAAASLIVNKPILKKPFSKAQLISQQLGRDQQKVVGPNYKTPFKDYTDVVKRLLRYHVFQARENTPDELRKGDELWVEVAEELLEKKRQMLNKYQLLLLNDSMRTIQPSEQVMLQRMFLTEERAQLQRDRHQAREDPLNFKPMPYISRANTAVTTSKCRLSDSTTETSVSDAVHSPVSLSGSPRHGRTGGSKTCVNGPVNCDSDSKCNGGLSPCTYTLQHTDGLKVVFKSSPIHPSSQRHSPSRYSGGEEVTLEGSSRRLDSSGSPRSKRDRPNRVLGSEDNTNKRLRLRDNDDELPFKSYTKNGVDAEYDTQTDSCVVDSEADMAVAGLLSSTDECTSDNLQTDVSAANTTSGTGAYNWDVTGKQEACNDVPYEEVTDDSDTPTWMYSGGELNMALGGLLSESDPQLVDSDVDALVMSHLEGGNSLGTLQNEMESAVNSIISLGHCNIPGAGLAGSGTPQFGNEQQPQDDLEMAIQSILT